MQVYVQISSISGTTALYRNVWRLLALQRFEFDKLIITLLSFADPSPELWNRGFWNIFNNGTSNDQDQCYAFSLLRPVSKQAHHVSCKKCLCDQ